MFLQKALGFNPTKMKARTEIIAGATTFLTMCYILAVNPLREWTKEQSLRPQQLLQP